MPSGRDRWGWLRSQGLGLCCGFAVVVLLAVGSFVLSATREGVSAAVGMDDLRGFFSPPSAVHLWLYLLFPVAGLYAVNTVLATWETVSRRWRSGVRAPSAYAASVVHVGFLLGLVAHAVGGFLGGERGGAVVASGWQELPGFGEARLLSLDVEALPDGTPKAARARVEVRAPGGALREETVGWNHPLSTPAGARLALLADLGQAWVAHLSSGERSCALAQGTACELGGGRVELVAWGPGPGGPAALLRAPGPSGRAEARWVSAGGELVLRGGATVLLDRAAPERAVALRVRDAPGTPWALAAAVASAAGIGLLWRRLRG